MDESKTRKAVVTPEGGKPVEVEIPADHPDPAAVAVIAYRYKMRAWEDTRKLSVSYPDQKPKG